MKQVIQEIKEYKIYKKITESKVFKALVKFYNYGNVKYVLFLYLVAFLLCFYTLATNSFTLPLSGDFVLQEIPFYYNGYDDWWTYITTGEFVMWDENTNLGVNNIGANSFYYLLNIFFLPTILVPRSLVPQMQAFLMISKMVLAGYVMKRLLDYFKVSDGTSKMIGVAYAFCGWTLYYLWFNHFIEITIVFPLVIWGLEKLLKEEKPTHLILSLFLSAMTNYFFFIMICFTTVIYAVFRYFQLFNTYTNKQKRNVILLGFFSYVIALIMSCIILLPCFAVALQSSRAEDSSYLEAVKNSIKAILTSIQNRDFDVLGQNINAFISNTFYFGSGSGSNTSNVSNLARVYLYPLMTFFYPTVSCNDHILINNNGYDNALSSLFIYTPLMLMLIPSILLSIKKKKVSHLIGVVGMAILVFTPFAYYCFSGFTNVCYGRWQLFAVVAMLIYIGLSFEERKEMKMWYFDVSIFVVLAGEIFLLEMGRKLQGTTSVNKLDVDATNVVFVQMAYSFIMYLYLRNKYKTKGLSNNLKWVIATEAFVSFNLLLGFTVSINGKDTYVGFFGTSSYEDLYGGQDSVKLETEIIKLIEDKLEDNSFYRVYNANMSRNSNNIAMVEGFNGMGTFHSIYGYEIDDFANWTHYKYNGSWSMGEHEKKANMDTFLNVKYYISNSDDKNIPFGYSRVELPEKYDSKVLYVNDNYIPLGFNFDTIISADDMNSTMSKTLQNSYYLNGTYSGYVPKAEYLLTSRAIMYENDISEILEDYPEFKYDQDISFSNYTQGNVYVRALANNEVKIRQAQWDDGPGGTGNFLNKWNEIDTYSSSKATGLKWNSELVATLDSPIAPNAKERGGAYVTITARMGENLIIYLYDQDGKEICSDKHMKHGYDKSADKKYERGFYVDRPVYKIKVVVKDTFKSTATLCKPNATYQYYDSYKANLDNQKQYQFTNVKVGTNKYTFSSNLNKDMISVLSIPYDTGWNLYRYDEDNNKEEIKVYKGQGGFVSFVNEKGAYSYKLVYTTPHLDIGCLGFIAGSMICATLYYSLEIISEEKRKLKELSEFVK